MDTRSLTVLICTHNREHLLRRVIQSLNAANRPEGWSIRLFVVANACTDGTHDFLAQYAPSPENLPLQWIAEAKPGKSYALNRALPMLTDSLVAFVDDDHRVDAQYFIEIGNAAMRFPEADIICGRILPDWNGTEPHWVHDDGPCRIYPLPVPRYDQGGEDVPIGADGPLPGGGNLVARLRTIERTGPFATELGPTGHDLGGSEDADWIIRAIGAGARLLYAHAIIQYHYVDIERLQLGYILRKGYQRSRSITRVRSEHKSVPAYMWRKIGEYSLKFALSLNAQGRRFYLVRLASTIGEIAGIRDHAAQKRGRARLPLRIQDIFSFGLITTALISFGLAAIIGRSSLQVAFSASASVSLALSLGIVVKSVVEFSHTGPKLRDEVLVRYRGYVVYALSRLAFFAFLIATFWGLPGAILWITTNHALGLAPPPWSNQVAAGITLIAAILYAGCRALSKNPGLIIASWQYRTARIHGLWRALSPSGLNIIAYVVIGIGISWVAILSVFLATRADFEESCSLILMLAGYAGLLRFSIWEPDGSFKEIAKRNSHGTNIVMIGSDTLRADRIGALRDGKSLTPNIDRLARKGTHFTACYVPCARTAPSLISLLTGTWPHNHGVRDNIVADKDTTLGSMALPNILRALGYRTAAVSDWCGADLGKFNFGFDILDLPNDQWNLKYLIRQGPKNIRLFLSIFLHNRIGRLLAPEIYHLGGVPQTNSLGKRGRSLLSRLAIGGNPFLLNIFYSTTHPPFASEYPYYLRHADPSYGGESKFAMARLTEPFEIIRRQGEPREEFDLDQILALYDGCVSQFDAEVGALMTQLKDTGLADNTILILYSDHGMEFFEHGSWGQGNSAIGDFSARVPLIIADPRRRGGDRVDAVVRSIDLLPTLLDLLEAPSVHCDGVSLRSMLDNPTAGPELPAFNETGIWITQVPGQPTNHLTYPGLFDLLDVPDDRTGTLTIKEEYRERVVVAKDRMVREGRWKLVYQPLEQGYRLALYDVESDPGCTIDLSATQPEDVARLWQALAEWIDQDPIMRRQQCRHRCNERQTTPSTAALG